MSDQSSASLGRAGLLVGVASGLANLLGFVFLAILSRAFAPGAYGEIAALLGLGAIGAVPSVAVQLLIARQLASGRATERVLSGRSVLGLGIVLFLVVMAASPLLRSSLHIRSTTSLLWLGLLLIPFTVAGGMQGHLLGAERFRAYAGGLLLISAARVATGCVALVAKTNVPTTMALLTVVTTLATLLLAAITDASWWWRPERTQGWTRDIKAFLLILSGIGAFMVLSGLDLLLARHYLSATTSGVYAIGSLFTKAGLWGPQFVAIVVFPRLSAGAGRGLFLRAAGAIALMGVAGVLVTAALGSRIVTGVSGTAYAEAGGRAWLFAVLGILFALVHLLLLGSLADGRSGISWAIWLAVAAEAILVATVGSGSLLGVLLSATVVTVALVLIGLGRLALQPSTAVLSAARVDTA